MIWCADAITLRGAGEPTGKKAALPATMAELLQLATAKLELGSNAQREQGDEYDADDVGLIGAPMQLCSHRNPRG